MARDLSTAGEKTFNFMYRWKTKLTQRIIWRTVSSIFQALSFLSNINLTLMLLYKFGARWRNFSSVHQLHKALYYYAT